MKLQRIEFGDAKTDGSLTHPKGGLMVNIEVKNEVGSGGGAIHVQNAVYAANGENGLARLLAYYDSVQSQALRQQLDFPYPTSFTASDGNGRVHFNILVAASAVYLIDFEWAGLVGTATYPYFMIMQIFQWPDGAGDGRLVTESHDLWWLRNFDLM
ncbi:TPA: hypothetical protein ACH3X3_008235 [Trebouxia sp. C0006]